MKHCIIFIGHHTMNIYVHTRLNIHRHMWINIILRKFVKPQIFCNLFNNFSNIYKQNVLKGTDIHILYASKILIILFELISSSLISFHLKKLKILYSPVCELPGKYYSIIAVFEVNSTPYNMILFCIHHIILNNIIWYNI